MLATAALRRVGSFGGCLRARRPRRRHWPHCRMLLKEFGQDLPDHFGVRKHIGFDYLADFIGMGGKVILDDGFDLATQILRAAGLRCDSINRQGWRRQRPSQLSWSSHHRLHRLNSGFPTSRRMQSSRPEQPPSRGKHARGGKGRAVYRAVCRERYTWWRACSDAGAGAASCFTRRTGFRPFRHAATFAIANFAGRTRRSRLRHAATLAIAHFPGRACSPGIAPHLPSRSRSCPSGHAVDGMGRQAPAVLRNSPAGQGVDGIGDAGTVGIAELAGRTGFPALPLQDPPSALMKRLLQQDPSGIFE